MKAKTSTGQLLKNGTPRNSIRKTWNLRRKIQWLSSKNSLSKNKKEQEPSTSLLITLNFYNKSQQFGKWLTCQLKSTFDLKALIFPSRPKSSRRSFIDLLEMMVTLQVCGTRPFLCPTKGWSLSNVHPWMDNLMDVLARRKWEKVSVLYLMVQAIA